MGHYLRLYMKFMRVNFRAQIEYRLGFVVDTTTLIFRQVVILAFISVILERFEALRGWTMEQVFFLYSLRLLARSLHTFFFVAARDGLTSYVQQGTLDRFLVRPINPLYHFFINTASFRGITDIVTGIFLFAFSAKLAGMIWDIKTVCFLIVVVLSGACIETAIFLMVAVIAFWTMEASQLKWRIVDVSEVLAPYPLSMYTKVMQYLFTFIIPFAFLNYYPATYFLDQREEVLFTPILSFLTPAVALIFSILAYHLWKLGLNRYQGAGS